jgi:formyl-CoA transferase
MFVEMDHPAAGRVTLTGSHLKFSDTPASLRAPSPSLGQHNEDVYCGCLGLSREEISELKREGVL